MARAEPQPPEDRMRPSAALFGLTLMTGARLALAEAPPSTPEPAADAAESEPPKPVPNWSFRLGMAGGVPVQSDQEELLELEDYGGPRWAASLSVAHKITDTIGAGGLVLYGWRSASSESSDDDVILTGEAPTYNEMLVALGAQLPISLRIGKKRDVVFFVAPWGGVGFANASFEGDGQWQTGPAFGAGTGLFFSRVHFGFSLGAYWVPLPPPGEAGGHNDFGMLYLSLFFGLDVG